jgi:DNA-binding protein H-NS
VSKVRELVAEYGLTAQDIFPGRASKSGAPKAASKVAAKYRDPANAANTWTGRGRMPQWVQALHSAGTLASAEIKTAE